VKGKKSGEDHVKKEEHLPAQCKVFGPRLIDILSAAFQRKRQERKRGEAQKTKPTIDN